MAIAVKTMVVLGQASAGDAAADPLLLGLGAVAIACGVWAVCKRIDVRLALLATSLALGSLAGNPAAIALKFLETFSNERFVVPICTAMGFAYVLKLTQCDLHLVHLLIKPLRRVRPLLIPGTVLVGFLVNIPVISQTSTAVTLGAVAIPILLAARIPAATVGAVLLLGSSVGGELLNPGAPELRTVIVESERTAVQLGLESPGRTETLVARLLPLNLLGLSVAMTVCWVMSWRAGQTSAVDTVSEESPPFRVNIFKAAIPVLPLALLFLTAAPLRLLPVPPNWLLDRKASDIPLKVAPLGGSGAAAAVDSAIKASPLTSEQRGLFDCRLIGCAMLIGVVVAALSAGRAGLQAAGAFFEGAGYGFANIISLIVAATCFGKGVELIRLPALLGGIMQEAPFLLMPLAALLPLAFGVLSGSGMASTQSLFGFFTKPAFELGVDPFLVGSIVALASAAGRTLSPFAAVNLMCATLTKTSALQLSAKVAPPLICAIVVEVLAAMIMTAWGW